MERSTRRLGSGGDKQRKEWLIRVKVQRKRSLLGWYFGNVFQPWNRSRGGRVNYRMHSLELSAFHAPAVCLSARVSLSAFSRDQRPESKQASKLAASEFEVGVDVSWKQTPARRWSFTCRPSRQRKYVESIASANGGRAFNQIPFIIS